MKEKNKKFMKALGIGAVATLGLFTMSGCSINLSDAQIEKVMYAVDNSDKFMKDTIDLLEKQNAKLNLEEAYNRLKLAEAKLITNQNGIRDNFKVDFTKIVDGEKSQKSASFLKTNNFGYTLMFLDPISNGYMLYEENDITYMYYPSYRGEGYAKWRVNCDSEGFILANDIFDSLLLISDVSKDNIYEVEILENGNFNISVIIKEEEEFKDENDYIERIYLRQYELTKDNVIVAINENYLYNHISEGSITEGSVRTEISNYQLKYNEVSTNQVNSLIQEAISKEVNK